jgi:hypothetical protein
MSARRFTTSISAPAAPATSDFLALADARDSGQVLLVQINLRAHGTYPARIIRISDREFTDDDGNYWQPLIFDKTTLDVRGKLGEFGWQPADYDLIIGDGRLGFQDLTDRVSTLLAQYQWSGTTVVVYQAFETLTDPTKWGVLFGGEVANIKNVTPTDITLACVQNRKWQVQIPPRTASRNDYPELPEEQTGDPLPIMIGDWETNRGDLHTDLPGGANTKAYLAGVARGAAPLMTINPSETDSETPEYFISDRQLHTAHLFVYILDQESGRLAAGIDTDVINPTGGPATAILDSRELYLAILGVDNSSSTTDTWNNSSKEGKNIKLEGFDQLDFNNNKKILQVRLPDVAPKGEYLGSDVRIWYSLNSITGTNPRFGIKNTAHSTHDSLAISSVTTYPSTVPQQSIDVATTVPSGTPISSGTVGDWDDIKNCDLYVEVQDAGQLLQLFRIALIVRFLSAGTVVKAGYTREPPLTGKALTTATYFGGEDVARAMFDIQDIEVLPRYAFNPAGMTYGKGAKDDGSGTYTGTASALIEHPADVFHYLLRDMGGAAANEITTATDTFGSFTDCRTTLANYRMLTYLGGVRDLNDIRGNIARQFLIWFYRRNVAENQPWVAIPWELGGSVNYRTAAGPFYFNDTHIARGSLKATTSSISAVRNRVRVNFDYDPRTNTYAEQVFITDADSRGWDGSTFSRDQNGGAPDNREALSSNSVGAFGDKERVLNLSLVSDPATATSVRNRFFDLFYRPRVRIRFVTFLNAVDLERGHIIGLDHNYWDDIFPCPVQDGGGTWAGKGFRVLRITRSETASTLYQVEAIEV